jgi:hypothetical protein
VYQHLAANICPCSVKEHTNDCVQQTHNDADFFVLNRDYEAWYIITRCVVRQNLP